MDRDATPRAGLTLILGMLLLIVGAVVVGRLIPVNEGEHIETGPGYVCALIDGRPSFCLGR